MDSQSNYDLNYPIVINEFEAKKLLKAYNIPVVEERLAADAEQAVQAARSLQFPVVVKGVGAKLGHKTEMGLVHLHLTDIEAVRKACGQIQSDAGKLLEGILVQPYIPGQREIMVGVFKDPDFGPVVLFGLGGVLAEAIEDMVMAIAPLTHFDALQMVTELKAKKILTDFRGEKAVQTQALIQILTGISRLAEAHPEISEIDVNPLRITPQGRLYAVDALFIINQPAAEKKCPPPVSPESIKKLFYPRSIAFVGASSQLGKWGNLLPTNTIGRGYQGEVYLVNSKGGTIMDRPVYPCLTDLPGTVDLVVVTVPASGVFDLLPQCQVKGIRSMVMITSGFGETGSSGKALEKKLVAAAHDAGVLMVGPNTMGIANPHINLYCTGTTVTPIAGGTAMVSQSGNMGTQLLAFAEKQGIGIRGFSGSGNEAMITIEDYLEGFEDDRLTRIVIFYVESLKNSRRFFESAQRVSRKKPIVLLKGGQTNAGKKAAASHTGAMVSDTRVFNAMCRQAGIIKVDNPMELLDLAAAFSSLPLPKGPRVAVMTLGGGWGVVTADLCQSNQLELPDLDTAVISILDNLLPPYWSRSNPVDLVGEQDLSLPMKTLETLIAWEGCDAVINLGILGRRILTDRYLNEKLKTDPFVDEAFLNQIRQTAERFETEYIQHITLLMEKYEKPIIGVHLLTDEKEKTLYRIPQSKYKGVFFQTPERAVNALAKMVSYKRFLDQSST